MKGTKIMKVQLKQLINIANAPEDTPSYMVTPGMFIEKEVEFEHLPNKGDRIYDKLYKDVDNNNRGFNAECAKEENKLFYSLQVESITYFTINNKIILIVEPLIYYAQKNRPIHRLIKENGWQETTPCEEE